MQAHADVCWRMLTHADVCGDMQEYEDRFLWRLKSASKDSNIVFSKLSLTASFATRSSTCAAYVSIRQHASAYVSMRQHASAYVSIRQHASAYVSLVVHDVVNALQHLRSIHQHTSACAAYISIRLLAAYISIRHLRSAAYISIRHLRSIHQHTSPLHSRRAPRQAPSRPPPSPLLCCLLFLLFALLVTLSKKRKGNVTVMSYSTYVTVRLFPKFLFFLLSSAMLFSVAPFVSLKYHWPSAGNVRPHTKHKIVEIPATGMSMKGWDGRT
jgi:hypothetical protein